VNRSVTFSSGDTVTPVETLHGSAFLGCVIRFWARSQTARWKAMRMFFH